MPCRRQLSRSPTPTTKGAGSLRDAIESANAAGSNDIIDFNIPGAGVHTILPATPLPDIAGNLEVRGYTQPGSSANTNGPGLPDNSTHTIEIDGTNTGGDAGAGVFRISSGVFVADGLVINRSPGAAIQFFGDSTGTIIGCYLGVDPTGLITRSNSVGIEIEGSQDVQIGGTLPSQRNVISGNSVFQIGMGCYSAGGSGHQILGNFIGPDATGAAVPAPDPFGTSTGIALCLNVTGVTIGGATPAERNVISGNSATGVSVSNSVAGFAVTDITIRGNYIGTDLTGAMPLGNGTHAISVHTGGNDVIDNVIAATGGDAVFYDAGLPDDGGVIRGNKIGTDVTGLAPLPNAGWGLHVITGGLVIGGTGAGEANVIAFNGTGDSGGIFIEGDQAGNAIRANSIHDNAGLGIDLNPIGPTANDAGDGDAGPNALQNFPVLSSATPTLSESPQGGTRVQGILHSAPSTTYDLDVFSNDACVRFPKDYLEGRTYLGSGQVTTDGSGTGIIDITVPGTLESGERVSMTATDPSGSTSEFSLRLPFTITPASSPAAGGTAVTISGTDFETNATVTIGGQPATNVVVSSFNQITATSPPLAAGTLNDVVVTNTNGTTGTLEKGFVSDFLDVPPATSSTHSSRSSSPTPSRPAWAAGSTASTSRRCASRWQCFCSRPSTGICYAPPACAGIFTDVPCSSTFAHWIEELAAAGHHRRLRRRQLLPALTPCGATRWRSSC